MGLKTFSSSYSYLSAVKYANVKPEVYASLPNEFVQLCYSVRVKVFAFFGNLLKKILIELM